MRMMRWMAAGTAALVLGTTGAVAEPGPGYFASKNVKFVKNIPLHTDSPGGRLVGRYFYLTTERDLTIYDVSKPAAPKEVGHLLFPTPQTYFFPEEDVDTNGKILLYGSGGELNVVDVSKKRNPRIIGSVGGADEHTISCVLDCTYAYGSEGVIVDLRNPRKPKIVGDWAKPRGIRSNHDVTEVAPGRIVTSSQPMLFLDARQNPAKPKLLATGVNKDERFIHANLWPNRMRERYLLVGGETGGPRCDGADDGALMTWDTRGWKRTHSFRMVDEYRVTNGLPTDGNSPVNQFCTHWFDPHPTYRNGGLLSMGWYEHGTRFLRVTGKGKIKEAGYFLALGASTSAAYWIGRNYVYTLDYNRGLDIIKFTGKP